MCSLFCVYTNVLTICLSCFDRSVPCAFVFQVEMFRAEKAKLDMEVAKWDDSGNDIIVMAKQMCMIMMEMTDFTRSVCVLFCVYQWMVCIKLTSRLSIASLPLQLLAYTALFSVACAVFFICCCCCSVPQRNFVCITCYMQLYSDKCNP